MGPSSEATPSQARCNGSVAPRGSVLRALVQLFLKLIAKADSAVIEVSYWVTLFFVCDKFYEERKEQLVITVFAEIHFYLVYI